MSARADPLAAAREAHGAGRLHDAASAYRRALDADPSNTSVRHLLGVVSHQLGDDVGAATLIGEAAREAPDNAEYARNLGIVLTACGRPAEAAAAYERALALEPAEPRARLQLASLYHQSGDPGTALAHYREALALVPDLAELHHQIGLCQLQLRDAQQAVVAFDECLARDPGHGDARENRARALLLARRFDAAEQALRELLESAPGRDAAWQLLGFARLHQGHIDDAAQCFLTPVRRRFAPGGAGGDEPADPAQATRTKLVHDLEQLEYLAQQGRLDDTQRPLIELHRRALAALPAETPERFFFDTPPVPGFAQAFNRLHLDWPAPRVAGGAVNPDLDRGAIAGRFHRDGWTALDEFLTPEALALLRRYAAEPTIWFEKKFRNEVGASLRNGFCCPLLLQIAEEIRQAFPDIFGRHLFSGCFSYKYLRYDSAGNVHADRGAVSLNLWIAPDSANLDPGRGGLVIWNKRVPAEYFLEDPNTIDGIHRRLLAEPDARASTIAYRSNRAMLFHSDVLHRTDRMRFRDGHANRRVSITFLYGQPGD